MFGSLRRILTSIILPGSMFLSTAFVQAGEADIDDMLKSIEKRLSDVSARQKAIKDGEESALVCKHCHGNDGNSLQSDVPNLAGQNAKYLLEQVEKFATRQRDNFVMSELVANFSPEDKVNIAIYYHSKPVRKQPVDESKMVKGQILYHSVCSSCHGITGHGNQKQARLAGQKIVYIMNVMKVFRKNAKNPAARLALERKSEIMEHVAKSLSDEQIESVAAYIAQLP